MREGDQYSNLGDKLMLEVRLRGAELPQPDLATHKVAP